MSHNAWKLGLATLLAAGAVSYFVWRVGGVGIADNHRGPGSMLGRAQQQFEDLPAVSWDEISDRSRVTGMLARAHVEIRSQDCGPRDALADSLAKEASAFLWHRFVRFDPQAYLAWQQGKGERFAPIETLFDDRGLVYAWQSQFGEPEPSAGADVGAMFTRLVEHWPTVFEPGARPVGMVDHADGAFIVVERAADFDGSLTLDIPETMTVAQDLWIGSAGKSNRSWWTSADRGRELFERDGSVCVGEVGVVMVFEDGHHGPVILRFVLNPSRPREPGLRGGWVLVDVIDQNMSEARRNAVLEY